MVWACAVVWCAPTVHLSDRWWQHCIAGEKRWRHRNTDGGDKTEQFQVEWRGLLTSGWYDQISEVKSKWHTTPQSTVELEAEMQLSCYSERLNGSVNLNFFYFSFIAHAVHPLTVVWLCVWIIRFFFFHLKFFNLMVLTFRTWILFPLIARKIWF